VDDHQLQLAAKLESLGLAVRPGTEITSSDVQAARAPLAPPSWDGLPTVGEAIDAFLRR
jgi:hypothetical protein